MSVKSIVTQLRLRVALNLNVLFQMTIAEAREVILTETENNLTHEIANIVSKTAATVKDIADKKGPKCVGASLVQTLVGDYVTEQTVTTAHLQTTI